MPIKGILFILVIAVVVAMLKREEIWAWLNEEDLNNTNEDEE